MTVEISKKAELFYKALEDIWTAEQIWKGSPNNAVWHCTQAAEKAMKGILRCYGKDYNYGHQLKDLLDALESCIEISPEMVKQILYLDGFGVGLRYKNMITDPTPGDAKVAMIRTKQIMGEFAKDRMVFAFFKEAEGVQNKILKQSMDEVF